MTKLVDESIPTNFNQDENRRLVFILDMYNDLSDRLGDLLDSGEISLDLYNKRMDGLYESITE